MFTCFYHNFSFIPNKCEEKYESIRNKKSIAVALSFENASQCSSKKYKGI